MNIWKESIYDKLFNWIVTFVLLLVGILTLYPFYYLLVYSLNDPIDAMRGDIYFWPRIFSVIAYKMVWNNNNLSQAAFISFARTVTGTSLMLFTTSMLSYVLSRPHLIWRRFFNLLFVITMYIGSGIIPWYLTMVTYGFKNTFLVYIIPGMIGIYSMILIRTYIQQLGNELWESAQMDGANEFLIFVRIILPLCLPVLAVVGIMGAVGQWNSWFDAAVFNGANDKLKPLQVILINMLKRTAMSSSGDAPPSEATAALTPEAMRASVTMIATVPIIAVYPFFQRYFAQGIMLGAVKG